MSEKKTFHSKKRFDENLLRRKVSKAPTEVCTKIIPEDKTESTQQEFVSAFYVLIKNSPYYKWTG